MNSPFDIDVTGCDLIALVKKAYELSKPAGMGHWHFVEGGLTDDEAAKLVSEKSHIAVNLDYVKGRAVKFTVYRDITTGALHVRDNWFDHTREQLQELLQVVGKSLPGWQTN